MAVSAPSSRPESSIAARPAQGHCRVCGAAGPHTVYAAREMMFGTREAFPYFQCRDCETLQIETIPQDLAAHYPPGYYSHRQARPSRLAAALRGYRDCYAVFGRGVFGRLLFSIRPESTLELLRNVGGLHRNARVLDVGCGADAKVLRCLDGIGFRYLLGADPYLESDIVVSDRLRIRKCALEALDSEFDLIMLHHSLEHVADPAGTLTAIKRILAPDGTVLLRIPTVSSYAWRSYGTNWVQLDAPRHLHLFSVPSLLRLARQCGFAEKLRRYDSTAFQFWGSEQLVRDVPLSASPRPARAAMARYSKEAARLNSAGDGDSVAFFLKHDV